VKKKIISLTQESQFDSALPEQLINVTPKKAEERSSVRLNVNGPAAASPFIVRLTREGERPLAIDPVAELANSLVFDEEEDAPLVLSRQDLEEQLREQDSAAILTPRLTRTLTPTERDEVSVPVMLELPEADVVEELFSEEPEFAAPAAEPVATGSDSVVIVEAESHVIEEEHAFFEQEETVAAAPFLRMHWHRALASFVALAVLVVFPLQAIKVFAGARSSADEMTDESKAALDSFLRGASSLSEKRFETAGEDFSKAAEEFSHVQDSLGDMHTSVVAVVNVIPQTKRTVTSVKGLVTAGEELSKTAEMLSMAGDDVASKNSIDLVTKLEMLSTYVEEILPHIEKADAALKNVDPEIIPAEYADKVTELKQKVPQIAASSREFLVFTDALSTILGGKGKVSYLAAFQNNTEIRPTGGFVGSFAEIEMRDGVMEKMHIPGGGSYANQGQLTEFVAAPGPVQLLKSRWEFQDANWFPDFRTSAKKMLWFSEHSGEPTMDGVIAVNSSFMVKLLEVLGPVDMPEYGRTITAENFLLETQKIVELEYDKTENAPKAFIGDLAPVLLDRLAKSDLPTLLSVMNLVGKGLEEKDILLYFKDNDLEAMMEELGWSGSMKQTNGDYLMAVDTNLGGGKTDGVIDETIDVDVHVAADGTVENTVTMTKVHHGMKSELFRGANNVDYLRLYVPKGSTLLSGTGFEIPEDNLFDVSDIPLDTDEDLALQMKNVDRDEATGTDIWEEEGKTVFGNWMQTAPGETQVVTFTYRLPFKLDLTKSTENILGTGANTVPYSLFVQKQPGVEHRITHLTVSTPSSVGVLWTSPGAGDNLTASIENNKDAFVAWLLDPR
jgi:hypothetical protein